MQLVARFPAAQALPMANITLPVRPCRVAAAMASLTSLSPNVSVTSVSNRPLAISFFTVRNTPSNHSGDCAASQFGSRNPEISAPGIIRSRSGMDTGLLASVP